MKFKKLGTAVLATAAVFALAACGNDSKESSNGDSDKIVTSIDKDTTVTFWHAMNGAQEEALTKITEDFMKENPKIKIELQNQSQYPDLQAKINSTLPSPKDLPTISQAYPGWLWNAAQDDMLVDLKPYMDDKTIGWGDQEEIRKPLLEGAQIEGKQYGIPFNKSTEALVYNADLLKEYGVAVPKTLEELKEASKTIYEKSNHEVVGAGFDSLNNYYVIGMENKGEEFTKDLKFDSKKSKEVIDYYLDGVKDGYFRIAGSDKYLSGPFANGKVAMFIGSIAGEGYVKKDTEGKFEYGVAPRPEKINLQQGTDIYMFNSATAEQKSAAFMYLKYLSSPDVQLYWAEQTGYMPVLQSVLESEEYKKSPNTKVPAILEEATKDLFSIPVKENADPAYNEVRAIMENILSNPNKDTDKLIKDSVPQLQDAWNQ
ncbi:ABC transporter substrate-binding protein [Enterococcus dispar]|jgi:multiple sugar transport system substrate-binding protein|uniref:ABC transporter substrate-binding protein n=1 Tax=Enterococcus dispar TaxID=44009 RepID=UPI00189D3FB1|nr:ABC transporter substrate-binding protein [Enterococcus dispar]MCU7357205.1 ABC transporter substrate-binding protein [Enterococcus dispar]MDT2705285.1 ABC transporter substrate-binding protein [Enterococcus dispar]WCG32252.1 ABC transporter substrate-binding protein [Enterococcus dispar]